MALETNPYPVRVVLTSATQAIDVGYFLDSDEVKVSLFPASGAASSELIEGAGYSITGAGNENGGTVTMIGQTIGDTIVIERDMAFTQPTRYPVAGDFSEENFEQDLDRMTMQIQQLKADVDSSIKIPSNETPTDAKTQYPSVADRASKLHTWDALGNVQASTPSAGLTLTNNALNVDFDPAGTGAETRSAEAKLREFVSVLDFGAVADATHTPTVTGADPTTGSSTFPSATDNVAAFQAAFAASKYVYVPDPGNGKWYMLNASLGSGGVYEGGLVIPDGGVLYGPGKILINPRYSSMGWSGGVPANGNSQGIQYEGDVRFVGITIDGGSQYTPIPSSGEEFTYYRTIGPELTSSGVTSARFQDCRFYNACGSHITGGASSDHSVQATLCHFGDYRDHAFYYSDAGDIVFSGNTLVGKKTTTTREAVKSGQNVYGMTVSDNVFRLPYGYAADMGGSGATKSTGIKFANNNVTALNGVRFSTSDDAGGISDLTIEGNTLRVDAYAILGGSFDQAVNVETLVIRDNLIVSTANGIPVLISSGASATTSDDANFLNRIVDRLIFEKNVFRGETSNSLVYLNGSFPIAEIRGNKFYDTEAYAVRFGGFDVLKPDASYAYIEGNTFDANTGTALVALSGTTPWASTDAIPLSIHFGKNHMTGAATRYLIQTGAATAGLVTGTVTYRAQDGSITAALNGTALSGATVVDLTETFGADDSGGTGFKLIRVPN